MTQNTHHYAVSLKWTGNTGIGTTKYDGYERAHEFRGIGKPVIPGSSDPAFRGDPKRWNPEELLLASVAACHKLVYLHLCHDNGVNVVAYEDDATGTMIETESGGGNFTEITLHPRVTICAKSDPQRAHALHHDVDALCFIAQSVNFPIHHRPVIGKEKS